MNVPNGFKRLSPGMYRSPDGALMQRGQGGAMSVSPRSGVQPGGALRVPAMAAQSLPGMPTGFKPLMPQTGSALNGATNAPLSPLPQQMGSRSIDPGYSASQDPSYQRWLAQNQNRQFQQPMGQTQMDRSGLMSAIQMGQQVPGR